MLTIEEAEQLAETFHLLGDANRLRLMHVCMDESFSVQVLADRLGLSQSLTSHHLRLLRAARLMRVERRGKQNFYRVADEHVRRVVGDMVEHIQEEV